MKFLFILGIVFFLGSIILIAKNFEKYNVQRYGVVVKMKIVDLPKSCVGARVSYYIVLQYNSQVYEKRTRGDFCEKHSVGEFIEVKFLEGSKNILFPNESALLDLISFGILGLME